MEMVTKTLKSSGEQQQKKDKKKTKDLYADFMAVVSEDVEE